VTMSKGSELMFFNRSPDKVYISVIFKKNRQIVDDIISRYPSSEIDAGGSGYDLHKELLHEIEVLAPDYSLYPKNEYSIGFSSRGCLRTIKTCPWCIVPIKEGKYRQTRHPKDWFYEKYDKIVFLDNNALADVDWFFEVTDWCIEKGLSVWFTQGLDIRLMDERIAKQILKMKTYKPISFAWDNLKDEAVIREKINLIKSVGFTDSKCRAKVQFYVYVDNGSDEEYQSGLYRARELKKLHCNVFMMYNIDNASTQRIIDLRFWANRKKLFWQFDIDEYKKDIREKVGYEFAEALMEEV